MYLIKLNFFYDKRGKDVPRRLSDKGLSDKGFSDKRIKDIWIKDEKKKDKGSVPLSFRP